MNLSKLKQFAQRQEDSPKIQGEKHSFDVENWLQTYNVPLTGGNRVKDGIRYIGVKCPNNAEHEDAAVTIDSAGRIGFKCFHDSCSGFKWKEFRRHYEPEKAKQTADMFFRDGAFIPPLLVDYLANNYHFCFDRGSLYIYDKTHYRPANSEYVKKKCQQLLADKYRDSRGNEVFCGLRTRFHSVEPCLDIDTDILTVANGNLNLQTLQLTPHSPTILTSIKIPVKYDPAATCPKVEKFMQDVLPADSIDSAYEFFGDCLTRKTTYQKAFMLTSEGDSGKSAFLNLITAFLGEENCSAVKLQDLSDRFRASSMVGKLANICADIPNTMIQDSGMFKQLVTGDTVTMEEKHQKPFSYRNFSKLIFSANDIPRSKDMTHGFYRRWQIIPFPNKFPEGDPRRDPNILAKLTTPAELSGLLNLALKGLQRLQQRGCYITPEVSKAAMEEYKRTNDSARLFLEENVEATEFTHELPKAFLYSRYQEFCKENGLCHVSTPKFNKKLKEIYPKAEEIQRNGPRYWRGVKYQS